MLKILCSSKISPWTSGILMALLFIFSLYVLDSSIGSLNGYSNLAEKAVTIYNGNIPSIALEEMFLIGVLIGAFIAALAGKQFKLQLFPEDHLSKGPAYYLTFGVILNLLGGFLVMAGMLIAGDTFTKIWEDALGLFTIVGLFLIIMFVEAVLIGTMMSLRIEEK